MKRTILILMMMATVGMVYADGWDPARPWTFWYWMYGAVSKEGIKADLEGMSRIGLGGCYLMPIYGPDKMPEYEGKATQLNPTFWEMVDESLSIADSLGLHMGIHLCDGFALAGGPWITPAESMQHIVFSDTIVEGSGRINVRLPHPTTPDDYYEDIVCYALPLPEGTKGKLHEDAITFSSTVTRDSSGTFRSNEPCWIQYEFSHPTTVRSIIIHPGGNNIQSQRLKLSVSDDGEEFIEVTQMMPSRQGWQDSGFAHTYSIPSTQARFFRFSWTPVGTEPGSEDLDAAKWRPNLKIKDIELSDVPRIHQWEGKAGYVWRVAPESTVEELPNTLCIRQNEMHRLTIFHDKVTTTLPTGRWLILRMGHASNGYTNATGGGARGLECDKFSQATVEKQINHWFGEFMKRPHSSVIKMLHVDSWECGSQNWNKDFAKEFKKRRGYDLLPWLPVMAGYPINSAEDSERVLRDVRKTINELVNDCFFSVVAKRAHEYGCELSSESMAPTMVCDGIDHFRYVDIPMGEYWLNSPTHDKPNDMADAISGAHIYGKRIIQGEGFTEVRGIWNETPAMIKPLLDLNLALGMNRLVFHVDTHNPWTDRRPGMTLDGIGLFFQRDQTWYEESKGLVEYITECQRHLQTGYAVADLLVFTGEEYPSRSLLPDRLVNILPGLIGSKRYLKEKERIENYRQPMKESPVGVNHSANIFTPDDWVNPLRGYQYDCINKDALLRLAKLDGNSIVLPSGNRYRVLVLPTPHPMNPSLITLSKELASKIEEFKKAGVIIIDTPHTEEDLSTYGISRDVEAPEGIAWTHRHDEKGETYFLSNQQATERTIDVSFREGSYTTIHVYDPLNKRYLKPNVKRINATKTCLALTLPAYGSVFVELGEAQTDIEEYAPQFTDSIVLDGEWDVFFKETRQQHHVSNLFDWSQSLEDGIKYYSGKTIYTTICNIFGTLIITQALLDVGEIHDLAHVRVNGIDCGIAWTTPYQVDISHAIKEGENEIEIEVVNTWANALRGTDIGHPPYDGIWTNAKYRMKTPELLPAGLLGPVVIKIEKGE
ncbi:MAG: discoidin domain-containing protein [Prevotella sp.]|nr:discoidin domain-containing protein [Prevotella sp.]